MREAKIFHATQKYFLPRCPDCGRVPPGRNVKQQLAVKKTVNKWKRNTGVSQGQDQGQGQGQGQGAGNGIGGVGGSRGAAAVTTAQHYNGGVAEKKDSIVMAKNSGGMRSSNIRHEVEEATKFRENFHNILLILQVRSF